MREHKLAAIISYVNLLVTNVAGIFMTPFIIRGLGDSEYGLYTLIGAFVGYLSILDLGLNNAIIRFVAHYRAKEDKRAEENFLAISFIIYAFIAVLMTLGGVFFYYQVDILFGDTLTLDELAKAKVMLIILILNVAITVVGGAFVGICSAYEKFVYPRLLRLAKQVLRIIMIIVIITKGSGAVGLVIIDSIVNVFFILGSILYVFIKLKIKIILHEFQFSYAKEIFHYSFWIFLFGLVYQFQWRTGQIILGTNTNTVVVAVYGVGVMLGIYFTTFGNVINGLLLPRAVKSIQEGLSGEELTRKMIKVGRLSLLLLLYVFGAFLITGQSFVYLWVGDVYKDAWIIGLMIMAVYIIPISQGFGHAVLEAKKLVKVKTLLFLGFAVLGMILGFLLSKKYNALGMAFGVTLSLFILQIVMTYYYYKAANLNMTLFFKETYLRIIPVYLVLLLTSFYINQFFKINWFNFLIVNIIYTVLFFVIVYVTFINDEEKQILFKRKF